MVLRLGVALLSVLWLAACTPSASDAFWGGFYSGYYGTTSTTTGAVQSNIVSRFNGFSHGNVYQLANGQIWQQTEFYSWYWYAYRPEVVIYSSYGTYRMLVQGIDHEVTVTRLR